MSDVQKANCNRGASAAFGPLLGFVLGLGRALGAVPRPLAALALGAWMSLIWWLSSGPIDVRPPLPAPGFFWNLAHAPVFGILTVLAALTAAPRPLPGAWPDPGRQARALAFLLVIAWAALDELHQSRVASRSASPFDFLTDAVAAACVLSVAAYAGHAQASEQGMRRRLAIAIALCALAALASTIRDGMA